MSKKRRNLTDDEAFSDISPMSKEAIDWICQHFIESKPSQMEQELFGMSMASICADLSSQKEIIMQLTTFIHKKGLLKEFNDFLEEEDGTISVEIRDNGVEKENEESRSA